MPADPTTTTLDRAVLAALADDLGDDDIVRDLVQTYLDELPGRVGDTCAAAAAGDGPGVRGAAHALASSSELLGVTAVATGCRDLEREAPALGRAELVGATDRLDAAARAAAGALRDWAGGA